MSDPSPSRRRRPFKRWRDWPLRRKGLAVVSLPVLALIAFSVLSLEARRTHDRLNEAEGHASRLRDVASKTLIAVLDIEARAAPTSSPAARDSSPTSSTSPIVVG